MPTDEEYRQLYEINYFSGRSEANAPSWLSDYPAIPYAEALTTARISAYRARLDRLAKRFPDGGTLLDVGMATGEFASMASARGWRVCGIDVSKEACRLAADRGIEAHCGSLSTVDLRGRRFDVVHLNHVFEHFTDPIAALTKLSSFLNIESLLLLEVPSQFDSWTRRLVNTIRIAAGRRVTRSVLSIHHPYFYSQRTLTLLIRSFPMLEIVWCRTYFSERWSGPAYRQVLRLIDLLGDKFGRHGESIEIAARLRSASAR